MSSKRKDRKQKKEDIQNNIVIERLRKDLFDEFVILKSTLLLNDWNERNRFCYHKKYPFAVHFDYNFHMMDYNFLHKYILFNQLSIITKKDTNNIYKYLDDFVDELKGYNFKPTPVLINEDVEVDYLLFTTDDMKINIFNCFINRFYNDGYLVLKEEKGNVFEYVNWFE